jgi:hypothetical protein
VKKTTTRGEPRDGKRVAREGVVEGVVRSKCRAWTPCASRFSGHRLRVEPLLVAQRVRGAADGAQVDLVGVRQRPLESGLKRPHARGVAARLEHRRQQRPGNLARNERSVSASAVGWWPKSSITVSPGPRGGPPGAA